MKIDDATIRIPAVRLLNLPPELTFSLDLRNCPAAQPPAPGAPGPVQRARPRPPTAQAAAGPMPRKTAR